MYAANVRIIANPETMTMFGSKIPNRPKREPGIKSNNIEIVIWTNK